MFETHANLLKKINAALLSHTDSHGVLKTEAMLEADTETALFIKEVAAHLDTTDFIAEVVATSESEPSVELDKVLNNYLRRQLHAQWPNNLYAKNSRVTVLPSDEDLDMDEYCKARDTASGRSNRHAPLHHQRILRYPALSGKDVLQSGLHTRGCWLVLGLRRDVKSE